MTDRLIAHTLHRKVRALHAVLARRGKLPEIPTLRAMLLGGPRGSPHLIEACGTIHFTCKLSLGMEPYNTQWFAAFAMLEGHLAEMATGEGKTLALALSAALAALSGERVHLITANDYLVERDARLMRALYVALGLRVGEVTAASNAQARRMAYRQDIVYVTARELVFDTLRDTKSIGPHTPPLQQFARALSGIQWHQPLIPDYGLALIDEADSILLDEAQTPFILSRPVADPALDRLHAQSLELARSLAPKIDFTLDDSGSQAHLTLLGEEKLEAIAKGSSAVWLNRTHRQQLVEQGLAALHILKRDGDYLVRQGQVIPIDRVTARATPGRMWGHGLHQMLAIKEHCTPPPRTDVVGQLTYPVFFRRYLRLAGMSGTLRENAPELRRLYGPRVVRVPLRLPSKRLVQRPSVFSTAQARWHAVMRRAIDLSRSGRPVLIATDSVAESQALAAAFPPDCDIAVLNAAHDAREASIVADAGRPGRITIATNMAGRGTDIELTPEVAQSGGLHVISCQDNPSHRIDRQIAGRCARRGQPGSFEVMRLWENTGAGKPSTMRSRALALIGGRPAFPAAVINLAYRWCQRIDEMHSARQRRQMIEAMASADKRLGFALPSS